MYTALNMYSEYWKHILFRTKEENNLGKNFHCRVLSQLKETLFWKWSTNFYAGCSQNITIKYFEFKSKARRNHCTNDMRSDSINDQSHSLKRRTVDCKKLAFECRLHREAVKNSTNQASWEGRDLQRLESKTTLSWFSGNFYTV
jgi:hypothetical protein